MNVVTANKNKEIIDKLEIDIIKRIDGEFELNELLGKFVNLYFNKMIIDITSIKNYQDMNIINELAKLVDPNRVILLLDNDPTVNSSLYMSNLIKNGFYNFTRNIQGINFLYGTPNTFENVKHLLLSEEQTEAAEEKLEEEARQAQIVSNNKRVVIGLANMTQHAGASTLCNMMVRQLNNHGIPAKGVEMFRQDLMYYRSPHLSMAMNRNDLERILRETSDQAALIMDLNEFGEADKFCDIILYLVEPSYIKITKMLRKNSNSLVELKDKNVVLNMSFVNEQELPDFEYETKTKVFANLPPMNDRNENLEEINNLLRKLGFNVTNLVEEN